MKKFLFSIALTITLGFTASAQFNNDGFFNNWDDNEDRFSSGDLSFVLPANHGFGEDTPSAPIGSGILVLTALGAGYAVARKRKSM